MPEETCQHELQLEEAGMEPAEELTGVSLSEEVVEQQFSKETCRIGVCSRVASQRHKR
jgi:hypothetical protein